MDKQELIKKIDVIIQGKDVEFELFELIEMKNSLRIADFVSNNMEKFLNTTLRERLDNLKEQDKFFVVTRKGV